MPRPQDSLPKQGGLGWVSSWGGVTPKPFTATPCYQDGYIHS